MQVCWCVSYNAYCIHPKQPAALENIYMTAYMYLVSNKISNEYFIFSSSENYEVLIFLLSLSQNLFKHIQRTQTRPRAYTNCTLCGIAVLHTQMKTSQMEVFRGRQAKNGLRKCCCVFGCFFPFFLGIIVVL